MDSDLFGLVGVHEKVEALGSYNKELIENWKEEIEKNRILTAELEAIRVDGQVSIVLGDVDEATELRQKLDEQSDSTERFKNKCKVQRNQIEDKDRRIDLLERRIEDLEAKLEFERKARIKNQMPRQKGEKTVMKNK